MFIVFLLLIQLCYAVNVDNCLPVEECTVKSWREWENCSGNCKNITKQVRKKTICVDVLKVQPFTRENVIQFCNITVPTVETRPCLTCPVGIYNVITQKCEKCSKFVFSFKFSLSIRFTEKQLNFQLNIFYILLSKKCQ